MTREDIIVEAAADEAGFTVQQAKRVYTLMNNIDEYSGGSLGLKVIHGKVAVDWQAGFSGEPHEKVLSQSLWDRIDDLDFDIAGLLEPIHKAWQAEFGCPYPTVFRSGNMPVAASLPTH